MSALTGGQRFRIGFLGRIILQVEYEWRGIPAYSRHFVTEHRWRDATPSDFVSEKMTTLKLNAGEE